MKFKKKISLLNICDWRFIYGTVPFAKGLRDFTPYIFTLPITACCSLIRFVFALTISSYPLRLLVYALLSMLASSMLSFQHYETTIVCGWVEPSMELFKEFILGVCLFYFVQSINLLFFKLHNLYQMF